MINDDAINAIIKLYTQENFPIDYIKEIIVIKEDGSRDVIKRKKIKELFPKKQDRIMGLMDGNGVSEIQIRVDKVAIAAHLISIDREVAAIINDYQKD